MLSAQTSVAQFPQDRARGIAERTRPRNADRQATGSFHPEATPALAVIVPVHNGQAVLSEWLTQLLDVLPDLTPRWELLIVDDGSTDATPEIAAEFAQQYPQVSVVHHAGRLGDVGAFRWGASQTRGEVLLFRASDCRLDLSGLHKLWKRMATQDAIVAREQGTAAKRWRIGAARGAEPPLRMIRRRMIEPWIVGSATHGLAAYLEAGGVAQHEGELRADCLATVATRHPHPAPGNVAEARILPRHCDQGDAAGKPRRPNYLARLRALAWGE